MNKSVLVIDTPKNCYECPFGREWFGDTAHKACCELYGNLRVEEEALITAKYYNYKSKVKPDWCPLRPLPEKRPHTAPVSNYEVQKNLFADGWNACLEEIITYSKSPEEIIKYYETKNVQIKRRAAQESQLSELTTLVKPLNNCMFNGMPWKII